MLSNPVVCGPEFVHLYSRAVVVSLYFEGKFLLNEGYSVNMRLHRQAPVSGKVLPEQWSRRWRWPALLLASRGSVWAGWGNGSGGLGDHKWHVAAHGGGGFDATMLLPEKATCPSIQRSHSFRNAVDSILETELGVVLRLLLGPASHYERRVRQSGALSGIVLPMQRSSVSSLD